MAIESINGLKSCSKKEKVEVEVAVLFERAILASKYTLRKILIIVVNEEFMCVEAFVTGIVCILKRKIWKYAEIESFSILKWTH